LAISVTGLLDPANEDKVANLARPFLLGEVAVMLWLVIMAQGEIVGGR
jgi:hypothetical protein